MVVRKMKTLDFCWAGLIQIDEFAVTIKSGHLQMKKYKQARPSFDFFFFFEDRPSFDLGRDTIYKHNFCVTILM